MNVSGTFKSKRVAGFVGVNMVFVIIESFFSMLELSCLTVCEFVCDAGRGCDKVAKVRSEWFVSEGNENVRAEAGGRMALGIVSEGDGWGIMPKRIHLVHPCSSFRELVSENIGDASVWVFANGGTRSSGKTVSHSIMDKIV